MRIKSQENGLTREKIHKRKTFQLNAVKMK
jgi:hypothetical protein